MNVPLAQDIGDDATPYLKSYLAPFASYLVRPDVTDIYVNASGELWVETLQGGIERHAAPGLDDTALWRLARQIASLSHQGISREHPLLSASLPDGSRVQVVAPPATRGPLALAIRKHVAADLRLADYVRAGAFASTRLGPRDEVVEADREIAALEKVGDVPGLLAVAVRARKNILIAGGAAAGKTTFLNALIGEIPARERLVIIEDTPELRLQHDNAVGLLAVKGHLGEARVTTDDLLQASLRMRPDRIILGELRGQEAYTFLRAVNTGHPGSMTTIHADSPAGAVEQLALIVLQAGTRLSREDIVRYVGSVVDVFVQLANDGGRRHVANVVIGRRPAHAPPP